MTESSSDYLLMCEVLGSNPDIVNLDQLITEMCGRGHEDMEPTQRDISMAFDWISQFRDVEHPVWEESDGTQ